MADRVVGRRPGLQAEGRTADDEIAAALRKPPDAFCPGRARMSGVAPFEAIAIARRLTAFDPEAEKVVATDSMSQIDVNRPLRIAVVDVAVGRHSSASVNG